MIRTHGSVSAETLHGGYQQTFLKITGTGVATADSVDGTTGAITDGNLTKTIRLIQTIATIVYIGPRHDNGIVIAVDGASAQGTGPAYDTDTSPTVTERIKAVLEAGLPGSITVTCVIPGMLAANVS